MERSICDKGEGYVFIMLFAGHRCVITFQKMAVKSIRNVLLGADDLCDRFLFQALAGTAVIIVNRNLRVAPGVEVADLVDALDGAGWGAPFFGNIFTFHIALCIFEERNSGRAALL